MPATCQRQGYLLRSARCLASALRLCLRARRVVTLPMAPHPLRTHPTYFHLGFCQGTRLSTRSCLRPLHSLHMDWRLAMSWFGGSLGMMWSIVQSLPSRCLLQIVQNGSRIVLA